jgi:hypothetical protein
MKLAIEILNKKLNETIDDKRLYQGFLKDKSNSIEMNLYFKDELKNSKETIESCRKAIKVLKNHLNSEKHQTLNFIAFFAI